MAKKEIISKRQEAIQRLVTKYSIEDQAALIALLHKECNIQTNQAAISRDIRTLGISKKVRDGKLIYEAPQIDVVTEIIHYAVTSIERNEVMIVINTVSGTAAMVGDYLDAQKKELPILATLSGENAVFVAPTSVHKIEELFLKLSQYLKIKDLP